MPERTQGRSRLYFQFVCQTTQLHGIRVGFGSGYGEYPPTSTDAPPSRTFSDEATNRTRRTFLVSQLGGFPVELRRYSASIVHLTTSSAFVLSGGLPRSG